MRRLLVAALLTGLLGLGAAPARAGRTCEARPPTAVAVQRALSLAQRVAEHLSTGPDQVVAIARVGQDLSAYGQRYSHLGFAYREGAHWRVAHKLNACGTAVAAVYRQGLGEFFLDDLYDYEAGIVVLSPELQARLLPVLRDNTRLARLNERRYSMVAHPWAQTYQQSNQWAIETLAMAYEPAAADRRRAQAWLQLQGYRPAVLRLSATQRLGARLTSANVAFDDHPDAQRFAGRIETVTADSVFVWLARSGHGSRPITIR
jgi:hypothetical protein